MSELRTWPVQTSAGYHIAINIKKHHYSPKEHFQLQNTISCIGGIPTSWAICITTSPTFHSSALWSCISFMLHQSFINSDVNNAFLMHTLLHYLLLEKAEWFPYGQHVCLFCYDTNRKLNVRRHGCWGFLQCKNEKNCCWEIKVASCIMVSKNLVILLSLYKPQPHLQSRR